VLAAAGLVTFGASPVEARDLRVTIAKHTEATPVQKLNREGVRAVKKNELEKAQTLFYKAYLIDPDDPFTLNNLGYLSELQGKVERAQKFYALASREETETVIAESSVPQLEGHALRGVMNAYGDQDLRINRGNIEAMSLLEQGRPEEAQAVLERSLTLDPQNPFTLNNLGLALEAQGDLDEAVRYYTHAASLHSDKTVVVALDAKLRGRPISQVAEDNAIALHRRLLGERTTEARVARLNVQGVTALNHNDPVAARGYFSQAYSLDPTNAFAINNKGYMAEMDGDEETANDYYAASALAPGASERVTLASHAQLQGKSLRDLAESNDQATEASLEARQDLRRRQAGPVELRHRDNSPIAPLVDNPSGVSQPLASPSSTTPRPSLPRPPVDNAPVDNAPISPPR
jgi:Flp pilus assembly protein TadD